MRGIWKAIGISALVNPVGIAATSSLAQTPALEVRWLSADQFVDANFEASRQAIDAGARHQLGSTFPNARTDRGVINWNTANFSVVQSGAAVATYEDPVWTDAGTAGLPAFGTVAAEAYFNCTSQAEQRTLGQTDVRTRETETTRTDETERINRVTTKVTLQTEGSYSYGGFKGSLGGSFAREWETKLTRTQGFEERTKVVNQTTTTQSQIVTVQPLTMRFHEYRSRTDARVYRVTGNVVIDVPISARILRPAYQGPPRRIRIGGGTSRFGILCRRRRSLSISGCGPIIFPPVSALCSRRRELR